MKVVRRPLTPLDKLFQGPAQPYSPGNLKKRPEPEPPSSERSEDAAPVDPADKIKPPRAET